MVEEEDGGREVIIASWLTKTMVDSAMDQADKRSDSIGIWRLSLEMHDVQHVASCKSSSWLKKTMNCQDTLKSRSGKDRFAPHRESKAPFGAHRKWRWYLLRYVRPINIRLIVYQDAQAE